MSKNKDISLFVIVDGDSVRYHLVDNPAYLNISKKNSCSGSFRVDEFNFIFGDGRSSDLPFLFYP